MKQLLVVLVVLVALVFGGAPFASAASSKHLQTVTCEGDVLVAHTVTVGHCSFTGPPAKHVYAKCKEVNSAVYKLMAGTMSTTCSSWSGLFQFGKPTHYAKGTENENDNWNLRRQ
jgi:hypothetical protein